ncbi:hypothetical protein, partial [Xanthomonas cerealis]|uniref:hypothetical protein n=1 Tax=Xanthomonas cerealis TaxID=3390025 RepID=UPI001C3FF9A0
MTASLFLQFPLREHRDSERVSPHDLQRGAFVGSVGTMPAASFAYAVASPLIYRAPSARQARRANT